MVRCVYLSLTGMLLALALAGSSLGAEEGKALVPSITVEGKGKATARPDMAQINVGVVTENKNASEALAANSEAMEKLLEILKDRGVAEKDIQTSSFSVSPRYETPQRGQRERPEIVGYQVQNMVEIKARKLDNLGAILDALVTAGANQVHGISFSLSDPDKALDEARRKAIADARRRAELYVKEADLALGQVLLIQETSPRLPQPRMFEMARAGLAADRSVPIASGEQEFEVHVTVTYRLP